MRKMSTKELLLLPGFRGPITAPNRYQHRELCSIARDLRDNWRAVYSDKPKPPGFIKYAWPYCEALILGNIRTASKKEMYGLEDAQMILCYLINALHPWRGEVARKFKLELNLIYEAYKEE